MQRRRRPRAAPKNIFGGSKPKETKQKPSQRQRPPMAKPVLTQTTPATEQIKVDGKPNAPGDGSASKPTESTKSKDLETETTTSIETENLVESQILGSTPERKSIGLKKEEVSETASKDTPAISVESATKSVSERAAELIVSSMERAAVKEKARVTEINKSKKIAAKPTPVVRKPRPRSRQSSSYQPAERARRLDRSRHMEYKYEMKGLLSEIDVLEEHRSNISATVWARGERKTAIDAKEFLKEKCNEGAIDDDQLVKLSRIVDNYTIRR